MKKKVLLLLVVSCILFTVNAQNREIDYYSIGYNDAVSNRSFDSKYSIEKMSKVISKMTLEQKEEFIANAEMYNIGYINGICKLNDILVGNDLEDMEKSVSNPGATSIPSSEEYVKGQREIYDWYTDLGVIQTISSDGATVRIDVAVAYKKDDKFTRNEIYSNSVEIKSLIRRYLFQKDSSELRNANNEDNLEKEIKDSINENILDDGEIKDVVFLQKDVISQE